MADLIQRQIRTKTKNIYFYEKLVFKAYGIDIEIREKNGYGDYDTVKIFIPYANIDYIKK